MASRPGGGPPDGRQGVPARGGVSGHSRGPPKRHSEHRVELASKSEGRSLGDKPQDEIGQNGEKTGY